MKMKYLILTALLVGLLVPAFSQPDPYYMMTGRQMTGNLAGTTGFGPWFGDNTTMYWGIDHDAYFTYKNNATQTYGRNMLYMMGTNFTMEKNLTISKNLVVTGTATIAGTAVSSGTIADNVVITADHTFVQSGTGSFKTGTGTVYLYGTT
jgi:hypothetical protein